MEWLDVRIPHAAAGDAGLRKYVARSDLPCRSGAPDRVRAATWRAVGHVGMRLQHGRRPPQLSVSRLRGPGAGPEARARRGSGRGAVRIGARPDGRAGSRMPQPATFVRRRTGRTTGAVRGDRLYGVAPTSRGVERGDPLVHGAPPGHEPALLRLCAAGAADAKAFRGRAPVPGDVAAAAGADPEGDAVPFESDRPVRSARDRKRPGATRARAE